MTTKLLPPQRDAGTAHAGRPAPPDDRRRLQRIWRSPAGEPRWSRPALLILLALTALLYLWDLSGSGYANSFYAAAVQAGTKSWKAFFFGSLDAGKFDHRGQAARLAVGDGAFRPALRLQLVVMLVPQALEGVALGAAAVRRGRAGRPARGLTAGLALALTPVAVLMFRFNNPDALLVLCLVAAAAYTWSGGRERPDPLAGAARSAARVRVPDQDAAGLPGAAGVRAGYLWAAPPRLPRRIWQALLMRRRHRRRRGRLVGPGRAAGSGRDRPYIGGSTNNSILSWSSATTAWAG